jgi:hypothetical protein
MYQAVFVMLATNPNIGTKVTLSESSIISSISPGLISSSSGVWATQAKDALAITRHFINYLLTLKVQFSKQKCDKNDYLRGG